MPKTYSKVSSCEASTDPESRRLKKDEKPKDSEKGLKSELSEAIVDDETPKSKAEALKSKIKKERILHVRHQFLPKDQDPLDQSRMTKREK